MNSKNLFADINFAWPTAEFAVMGPEGAVNILYRKELKESDDPEKLRSKFTEDYRNIFASPYIAAEMGFVDDIIMPSDTRPRLINALEMLQTKEVFNEKRKHGNMPL